MKNFKKLIAWMLMASLCASMGMTAAYAEEAHDGTVDEHEIDQAAMDADMMGQLETELLMDQDIILTNQETEVQNEETETEEVRETETFSQSETVETEEATETEDVIEETETEEIELEATAQTVTMSQLNAPGVAVTQSADGDGSCLLSAITSLFRRAAYLSGDLKWSSITKNDTGTNWQMTVHGVTVISQPFQGDLNTLVSLLKAHPEGIVIYCEGLKNNYGYTQHAVLLTDFTNNGLFAFDPIPTYYNKYGPRMPLLQTSLGRDCGTIAGIVSHITRYWYVTSPSGLTLKPESSDGAITAPTPSNPVMATTPVTGIVAEQAGNQLVKLTWNAQAGADGYLIYAMRDGIYGKVGGTTVNYFYDKMALYKDYNYYWVFAYKKLADGKLSVTSTPKYVYAKGICKAVTDFRAASVSGGVKLSWTASKDAEGYLVYGIVNGSKYRYVGMTTVGTSLIDRSAKSTGWSFYWVYPFFRDGNGKMIVGGTPKYVYGRAK